MAAPGGSDGASRANGGEDNTVGGNGVWPGGVGTAAATRWLDSGNGARSGLEGGALGRSRGKTEASFARSWNSLLVSSRVAMSIAPLSAPAHIDLLETARAAQQRLTDISVAPCALNGRRTSELSVTGAREPVNL